MVDSTSALGSGFSTASLTAGGGNGCWSRAAGSSGNQNYLDIDGYRLLCLMSIRPLSYVDGVCCNRGHSAWPSKRRSSQQCQLLPRRVLLGDTVQRISGMCKLWAVLQNLSAQIALRIDHAEGFCRSTSWADNRFVWISVRS